MIGLLLLNAHGNCTFVSELDEIHVTLLHAFGNHMVRNKESKHILEYAVIASDVFVE